MQEKKRCDSAAIMCDCLKASVRCRLVRLLLLPCQNNTPHPPTLFLSTAYRCYAHYLKIEVSQSHPVMKAFCGMLLQSLDQENKAVQAARDAEEGL